MTSIFPGVSCNVRRFNVSLAQSYMSRVPLFRDGLSKIIDI